MDIKTNGLGEMGTPLQPPSTLLLGSKKHTTISYWCLTHLIGHHLIELFLGDGQPLPVRAVDHQNNELKIHTATITAT